MLEVRFDCNLVSRPTAAANWTGFIRYNAPPWTQKDILAIADGTIIGKTVTIPMQQKGVGNTDNTCSYAAAPPDVLNLCHIAAAPFTGFPLTVV